MESFNFWDSEVWGFVTLISVLLLSLLIANSLKKSIKFLRVSLIPTSVLGGMILLLCSVIYQTATGKLLFDTAFFGGNGMATMEMITYHCLALGFIATTFRSKRRQKGMRRTVEVFNTGVTTVATYLLQGVLGMGVTMIAALFLDDLLPAAGLLLPFGYGQGTGQALNYGNIYEVEHAFAGGRSFGLTIAALGFMSAAIGGVIHLNVLKKKGKITIAEEEGVESMSAEQIQGPDEIPMNGSIDKMTVQIAIILLVYMMAFGVIALLATLLPGFKSILYGFNFLLGTIFAALVRWVIKGLKKAKLMHKEMTNNYLLDRISGFMFDLMIIAGVAAIDLSELSGLWWQLTIVCALGATATFIYLRIACNHLYPEYKNEAFFSMFGMLTGTASNGMILLREIDPKFETPAANNLVLQSIPAIAFGGALLLLFNICNNIQNSWITLGVLVVAWVAYTVIIFRKAIFKKAYIKKAAKKEQNS